MNKLWKTGSNMHQYSVLWCWVYGNYDWNGLSILALESRAEKAARSTGREACSFIYWWPENPQFIGFSPGSGDILLHFANV